MITISGGAVAAAIFWTGWQTAICVGTLVMVTGPTVINPLLKRLKVKRSVATVLEAEGVPDRPSGAVTAIVALEVALSPAHGTPWSGSGIWFPYRFRHGLGRWQALRLDRSSRCGS
ncbi:MAG: hypothetical protein R2861_07105 [Desulfobacterales bacterium]